MNLRKRSQHDHISAFPNKSKRIGWIIEKFEISFVENDNDVLGDARHEAVDRALRNQGARRVVRVRNENQARFRRDCIQCRAEVLLKIQSRQFDRARSERGRKQFIDDKRILKNNYVIARIQKRVTEKFDHLI